MPGFAFSLLLGSHALQAQDLLHDPMRPLISTNDAGTPLTTPGSAAARFAAEDRPPSGASVRMLVIGREKSVAIIDGQLMELGNNLKQWQLISIGPHSVVMRNAATTHVIGIHPAVIKTLRPYRPDAMPLEAVNPQNSRNSP